MGIWHSAAMDERLERTTFHQPDWLIIAPDLRDDSPLQPIGKKHLARWELVLLARAIPFRTAPYQRGKLLLVPATLYPRAKEELRLFEEENHNWPPPLPADNPQQNNLQTTLCVLILLATFHNLTQLNINLLGHH
ncbi:MAG: rhomboid family intramembrane serine protease, partial [Geopsychrobacter sp.]|nr:rhomboid family intramembrane serine protease [Geopsychrobacter sp.]